MDEFTRLFIAFAIIAAVVLLAVPAGLLYFRKRKRMSLRRRGIKRYGH
jgi:LPXTG-motif cell wall-anchored protein